jgi:hypothetical protein
LNNIAPVSGDADGNAVSGGTIVVPEGFTLTS